LIVLEEQDRRRWDRAEITEGRALLERALRLPRAPSQLLGPDQLQAAIAAVHADDLAAADTDWPQIATLYGVLLGVHDTPVTRLNHAVAVALGHDLADGLSLVRHANAGGALASYHLYHAAEADLLRRLGCPALAAAAYERALALTQNAAERTYLLRRLDEVTS
jgi:RNA polymerase sigma-70 factor (ECF subfamily)